MAPVGAHVSSLLTYAADGLRHLGSTQALYVCPLVPWGEDL